jgi:hypothetical protein
MSLSLFEFGSNARAIAHSGFTVETTDVAVSGCALLAPAGPPLSKLGVKNRNVSRHIAARLTRIGKNAQSESASSVRGASPCLETATPRRSTSVLMSRKLGLYPKVPAAFFKCSVNARARPLVRLLTMETVGNHTKGPWS